MTDIKGTLKADKLAGSSGNDVIQGYGSNDVIIGATGSVAGSELLVDGSFETASVGAKSWTHFKEVGGWKSDTGIEVWGKDFIKTASAGDKLMELDFDRGFSKVWQDVRTEAGQEYNFSFDSALRPGTKEGTNTINVFWNDKLVGTVNPGEKWHGETFKVVGTGGTDKIEFRESGDQNDSYGGLIDNVSLRAGKVDGHNILVGGGRNDTLIAGDKGDMMVGDGMKGGRVDASKFKIAEDVTGHVTWQGETAGYKNAVGMYTYDKAGHITGVQMLFANGSDKGSGGDLVRGVSGLDVKLAAGDNVGFFVAPNAFSQKGMDGVLADTAGSFKLVDAKTGKDAVVGSGGEFKLVHVGADGKMTDIVTQYGKSLFTSSQANNADGYKHDIMSVDPMTGRVTVSFEDLWNGGDKDFDDMRLTLDIGQTNAMLLGRTDSVSGKGPADDVLIGGAGNDKMFGMRGDDRLSGGAGNDKMFGGSGNDVLTGGAGDDVIHGNSGNDRILADAGNDSIFGDAGFDTLDFSSAGNGVKVDLKAHTADGAGSDTVRGIEGVVGTAYADHLAGDKGANALSGGGGDDMLRGRGGADVLTGGEGNDTFKYYAKDVVDAKGNSLGVDHITDFSKGDVLDLHEMFEGLKGDHTGLVAIKDDGKSSHVYANVQGAFVEVAVLEGFHGATANDLMKAGMLLV